MRRFRLETTSSALGAPGLGFYAESMLKALILVGLGVGICGCHGVASPERPTLQEPASVSPQAPSERRHSRKIPKGTLEIMIPPEGTYVFTSKRVGRHQMCVKRWEIGGHTWACTDERADCLRHDGEGILTTTPENGDESVDFVPANVEVGESWEEPEVGSFSIERIETRLRTKLDDHDGCLVIRNAYAPGWLEEHEVVERDYYCPGYGWLKTETVGAEPGLDDKELIEFHPGVLENCRWPDAWLEAGGDQ